MINLRETEISKGQPPQRSNGIVGADLALTNPF
jgi:hypothetical protein